MMPEMVFDILLTEPNASDRREPREPRSRARSVSREPPGRSRSPNRTTREQDPRTLFLQSVEDFEITVLQKALCVFPFFLSLFLTCFSVVWNRAQALNLDPVVCIYKKRRKKNSQFPLFIFFPFFNIFILYLLPFF